MHDGVYPGLHEDEVADDLVQVDVVVQREDGPESEFSHDCDSVAEDQDQDQHGVVQQGTPWKS